MKAVGWIAVGLPFVAAVASLLLDRLSPGRRRSPGSRESRSLVASLVVLGTAASTGCAIVLAAGRPWRPSGAYESVLGQVPTGLVDISVALRVDGLAVVVALMVCLVALAVQVYSIGYMADEPRYSSYAALVSLFTAAMLLVVLAGDLFVLLVGWEVMGICSYFLIGHYWERADARPAAVKAFLVTRIGDAGFLFGIFAVGVGVGSFRIAEVNAGAGSLPGTLLTTGTLLLACGVVGKSAQFPLHVWLPDAMAGPTPISALIHAATMVAAGIYLVVRLWPLYALATVTLAVLGVVAAVTMLGSALAALAQDDIKRVLAYSTVSQLAYMLGALAVGSPIAATFHLLTHGAFKALLFLGAGAVIHAAGSNLMSAMSGRGGLRQVTPTAFWTMTLALAALVGLPPLSGFFSKESVLTAAEHAAAAGHAGAGHAVAAEHALLAGEAAVAPWVGWLVLVTALVTVAVTAAYAARLWLRTFFAGRDPGMNPGAAHPIPATMRWPLVALAVPTVLLGVAGLSGSWLPTWLGAGDLGAGELGAGPPDALVPGLLTTVLSLLAAAAGLAATYLVWRRDPAADPARVLGTRLRTACARGFFLDELYDAALVRPTRALARATVRVDDEVVDATVVGAGTLARFTGGVLRLAQNGNVQGYLTGLLAGVVIVLVSLVAVMT